MQQLALKKGKHVVWANTLEGLAQQMEIPVEPFLATVQRYNELCAKGHDDDFLKPASHMLPIEKGPFFAIHNHLAHDGVFGGFAVDQDTHVIDENGQIIPGLYAAGDNTSSRYINSGGEKREIMSDLTWAFSSGYLAGSAMARDLPQL
jgi:fumarate reductase flavoprotein subunit